jgi:serine/threonine protein phosphatase 1
MTKPRVFVLGDVHGAYRALLQCLERSSFDFVNDTLIFLGDVCDGWPETRLCVDKLLTVRNLVYVLGNHDWWMLEWLRYGTIEEVWYSQGGKATMDSYAEMGVPANHKQLLESALLFYELNEKVFVHAGIIPGKPLREHSPEVFLWDRSLARIAIQHANNNEAKLTSFAEIFIGHTPVSGGRPVRCGDVWMMDTGAGWSGVLSMMDIHSKEVYVSDPVPALYPGIQGRSRRL